MAELPKYRCHKEVEAFKITHIQYEAPGSRLHGGVGVDAPVSCDYMDKHQPWEGGYYVRYADGYESFSPAEAFEAGYTLLHEAPPVPDGGEATLKRDEYGWFLALPAHPGIGDAEVMPAFIAAAQELGWREPVDRLQCRMDWRGDAIEEGV